MDKKAKKQDLNKVRASCLKAAISKDKPCECGGKCDKCKASAESPESPIKAMLQRLSSLGLPGLGSPDGSAGPSGTPTMTVIKIVKATPIELEVGSTTPRRVLEKNSQATEEKHTTSKFVERCVAAVTKGRPADRDEESSAFAKCVATQNKSKKDLNRAAEERPGMDSRERQFEKSLDKVRKNHKHDN